MGVRPIRPQEGHRRLLLERSARADDLAVDRTDRLARESTGPRGEAVENPTLALRVVDGQVLRCLGAGDAASEVRTLVEQAEDAVVDLVDPPPELPQRQAAHQAATRAELRPSASCQACDLETFSTRRV